MPPEATPTPTTPVNPSEPVSTPVGTPRPTNPPGPGQQPPVNPTEPGSTTPIGNPGPNPTEPRAPGQVTPGEATVDYSTLAPPAGYELPENALADFRAILAEHKLPLEAGAALLQYQATLATAARNAEEAATAASRTAGVAELKADPDFGGIGGVKYAENLGRVRHAVTEFWGAKDGEQLLQSGILDSPSFTRGLLAVAKATAEAPLVPGTGTAPVDPLRARYPNMPDEFFSSKAA
jgi:hypothetical protein